MLSTGERAWAVWTATVAHNTTGGKNPEFSVLMNFSLTLSMSVDVPEPTVARGVNLASDDVVRKDSKIPYKLHPRHLKTFHQRFSAFAKMMLLRSKAGRIPL